MDEMMPSPAEVSTTAAPAPEKKPNQWTSRSKEVLEVSGKMIIGVAGLCYVLGLVVVTTHLRQYGLNSLDLPQLHYVTAGVWTLLPIIMIILLIVFLFYVLADQKDEIKKKRGIDKMASVFGTIAGVIIVSFLILRFLAARAGVEFGWVNWVWIPTLGLFALCSLVLPAIMLGTDSSPNKPKEVILGVGLVVVGIVSAALYVTLFATHTYETIPWSTGGGSASQVRLVVAPESRPYLEVAGIPFSGSQTQTEKIKLLLTTDKQLVIVNSSGKAVSVPSDMVKLVVYEK